MKNVYFISHGMETKKHQDSLRLLLQLGNFFYEKGEKTRFQESRNDATVCVSSQTIDATSLSLYTYIMVISMLLSSSDGILVKSCFDGCWILYLSMKISWPTGIYLTFLCGLYHIGICV